MAKVESESVLCTADKLIAKLLVMRGSLATVDANGGPRVIFETTGFADFGDAYTIHRLAQ